MADRKRKSTLDMNPAHGIKKSNKITTIESLPTELIVEIGERLSFYDKLHFSMTCILYHNIFNSFRTLYKDKLVKVFPRNMPGFINQFYREETNNIMRPSISALEFNRCNIRTIPTFLWEMYKDNIISLRFINCEEYFNLKDGDIFIARIVSSLRNLEHLEIHPIISKNFLHKLSKLENLKLKSLRVGKISDDAFGNFIFKTRLKRCLTEFYPYQNKGCSCCSTTGNNITLPMSHRLDKKHLSRPTLSFGLTYSNICSFGDAQIICQDKIMETFCNIKEYGFHLKKLNLKCHALVFKNNAMTHLCTDVFTAFENSLEYLNITRGSPVGFGNLKNLTTLKLPSTICTYTLEEIIKIKTLRNLSVGKHGFTVLDPSGKPKDVPIYNSLQPLLYLQKLEFNGVNMQDFHKYLNLPNSYGLTSLSIECCTNVILVQLMAALCNNRIYLTDFNYVPIEGDRRVVIEDISICRGVFGPIDPSYAILIHAGISALKNLNSLKLPKSAITDHAIFQQFKWKGLTELNLSGNTIITNDAMPYIARNNPSLTSINLAGCRKITDDGVQYLTQRLPRLRKIDLSDTQITEAGIRNLINSPCPITECVHSVTLGLGLTRDLRNKMLHIYKGPVENMKEVPNVVDVITI